MSTHDSRLLVGSSRRWATFYPRHSPVTRAETLRNFQDTIHVFPFSMRWTAYGTRFRGPCQSAARSYAITSSAWSKRSRLRTRIAIDVTIERKKSCSIKTCARLLERTRLSFLVHTFVDENTGINCGYVVARFSEEGWYKPRARR